MSPNRNPYQQTQGQPVAQSPQPGYNPQGQYNPQPQYMANPQYAASPAGYYPQPGYYPVAYAAPMDTTNSTIAGVMWILCLVRDILYLIGLLFVGSLIGGFGGGGLSALVFIFMLFPLIGVIGSAMAMSSDFSRKNHQQGTIGAVLALIGSSFPGIILVGPIGMVLAIIGLVLHLQAKPTFSS